MQTQSRSEHAAVTAAQSWSAREQTRVAMHLARAEGAAATADVTTLDPLRRLLRALLLDELAHYRREGRFPRNHDFAVATPAFVDAAGTRCAMAHLLEAGGASGLVERIARERNHAYVHELADEPTLLAWLAAAGLTVDEAAAIQPAYEFAHPTAAAACLCRAAIYPEPRPARGVLEAVVVAVRADDYPVARIEAVHGDGGVFVVGDIVRVAAEGCAQGARVLVPLGNGFGFEPTQVPAGLPLMAALVLGSDDAYHCGVPLERDGGTPLVAVRTTQDGYSCAPGADGGFPALPRAQVIATVQAADCSERLVAADPNWGTRCAVGVVGVISECRADAAVGDAAAYASPDPRARLDGSADAGPMQTRRGCDARPAGTDATPTTLGILLALVSTLLVRRAGRRALRSRG